MAKAKNAVTKIPSSETIEVQMPYPSGNQYLITYNPAKDIRTLWRKIDGGYENLQTADSPVPFYDWVAATEGKRK